MGIRDRIRNLERAVEGEVVALRCRGCGEGFTVAEDTDLELLAREWALGAGVDPHQPTPPEILSLTEHPCGWEALEVKATGKPWPLSDVGGGVIGLTVR